MTLAFLIALVTGLVGVYGVRVLFKGRYQHDRAKKEPGSVFLGRWFIELGYWYFHPMERLMMRLGVTRYAVATKIDKLTQAERRRHLAELEEVYSGPVMAVSAQTGEGLDELWKKIASLTRATQP